MGWTSIYQLFWGSLGTRVLTHPHLGKPVIQSQMETSRASRLQLSMGNSSKDLHVETFIFPFSGLDCQIRVQLKFWDGLPEYDTTGTGWQFYHLRHAEWVVLPVVCWRHLVHMWCFFLKKKHLSENRRQKHHKITVDHQWPSGVIGLDLGCCDATLLGPIQDHPCVFQWDAQDKDMIAAW